MSDIDTETSLAWTGDHGQVHHFAEALADADHFPTPRDLLYYFEKPWKWNGEYEAWVGCGRPSFGDENWDAFVHDLAVME